MFRRKQPPAPPNPPLNANELVILNNTLISRVEVIATLTLMDEETKDALYEKAKLILRDEAYRYLTHEVHP